MQFNISDIQITCRGFGINNFAFTAYVLMTS